MRSEIFWRVSQISALCGCALSQGFYWGRQVQERLDEIAYTDMGEDNWHDQQNHGEISLGELHRGGTRNPIRVDISTTCHLGRGGCVFRSGEDAPGNLFASYFLRKEKPLIHSRSSNNDAGQEIWIGTTESSNVSEGKIPKFSEGKCGANSGRGGGGSFSNADHLLKLGEERRDWHKNGITRKNPKSRV